ncbi:MAG: single-stranded-DNA-specific exonuclease RecJ [Chthonomonas sp.]|nr:single-stranded-DNA-specific exonuclease RecJ [Chthonomonas sp.]
MPVATSPILKAHPRDIEREDALANELGLQRLTAGILVARGYDTAEKVHAFLRPSLDQLHDPELLPGYREGADILLDAIKNKRRIYLHGDYDVDGVTSAAIFSRFFDAVGANYHVHVPHRINEGYGLHDSAVQRAVDEKAEIFLTCDCGITANEPVRQARELGMKVVITDHHEPDTELPPAHAILNPHLATSRYPFDQLCGAGVVLKFCAGLARELGHPVGAFYRNFLDLAALGTVSDMMPLLDENRVITHFGLQELGRSKKHGLAALREYVLRGATRPLVARDIGFGFGPRLNASGRMEDAATSLRLLLTRDDEEAQKLATYVEEVNLRRRQEQDIAVEVAVEMVEARGESDRNAIVVYNPEWHPGLIGLIAGKLVDVFYRPTFVLTKAEHGLKGSARSIEGFNLFQAIQALRDECGLGGGGHAAAAGINIAEENLDKFSLAIHEYVSNTMSAEQLTRTYVADAEAELAEFNMALVEELDMLAPFGQANPEPSFLVRHASVMDARYMGKEGQHLIMKVRQGNSKPMAVKVWNYGAETPLPEGNVQFVGKPGINEWQGRRSIEIKTEAVLPA